MTIDEITEGLRHLLEKNHFNSVTIAFYEREWNKIRIFLSETYGNLEFDMERGLEFLEQKYQIQSLYNKGSLSQQRVQLIRVVHMLEDYRLHQVLTRRYYAAKNPIQLNQNFEQVHVIYTEALQNSSLSKSTTDHYISISRVFLDYLEQKNVSSCEGCFWQVVFSQFGKIKCRIWQLQKSEFGKGPFESKKFGKRPFAAEILPTSQ